MRSARWAHDWIHVLLGLAVFAVLSAGAAMYIAAPLLAQSSPATGAIEGAVTADHGDVRALRVRATDTVGRILYTVFTRKGRYHFLHLPPGRYDVEVVEEAFACPRRSVEVRAGSTQTVDLALTAKARESTSPALELTTFDALYAPAPALDLMKKNGCFECHWGPPYRRFIHHMMGPRSEAQWRRAVERMFDPKARLNGVQVGAHVASLERISPKEKESIIQYLSTQFGPDYKRRDVLLDPLVRDEDALANALYIQYALNRELGSPFEDGTKPGPTLHSIGISERTPGVLWLSGVSSSNMVRVDTRDPNFQTRTREWRNAPYKEATRPHGVIERAGRVWWAEVGSDRVGEMDTQGGAVRGHALPTAGASPHDVWPDSKGNLWISYWSATGKVGRLDMASGRITESETVRGASGYGIVVDRRDRVWAVGLNIPFVQMRDPESERWKQYPISSPARRVSVDSKGKVWVNQYFGNAISMIDPETGKVTEYPLPLKYGNPYDVWPDLDDTLWIENSMYNALVRFDQKTKAFTYFPFPDLNAHTYKMVSDSSGAIWFGLGSPTKLTAFKVNGNAPLIRRQSQSR